MAFLSYGSAMVETGRQCAATSVSGDVKGIISLMTHPRFFVPLSRGLYVGLLGVLVAVLALGGAAFRAHGTPSTTASSTSTLRIWYASDDPTERSWATALANRFAAQHRNIKVDFTVYGLEDVTNKLQLALAANRPPDLIYTTPRGPGLPAYVRAGKLLDLTAAAKKHGWARQLRPNLLSDYNTLLAANGSSHDKGRIYAVPYVMAVVGVLYNRTLFSKLHLSVPHTQAQLEALLPRIKKAGYTPLGLGNADGWVGDDWYLTLVNARVAPSTLTGALRLDPHFSFKGNAFQAAGATLQSWSKKNYFTRNFGGLDAQDSVTVFFEGRTAMQLVSSTENSQILSLAQRTRIRTGIFAFPSARSGARPVMPQSGYAGWAIPRDGHNASAALDFIDYAISGGVAQTLLAHGMLPAHHVDLRAAHTAAPFQKSYLAALDTAEPGVYLDSAPIPNINATMEANVQLLLQGYEAPGFLTRSLQQVYTSRGKNASSTRTDGEF